MQAIASTLMGSSWNCYMNSFRLVYERYIYVILFYFYIILIVLCCARKCQSVHSSRTTQYLRHPSTLKAVIWCVATYDQTLFSQKISVQSEQWFLRYCQICVENHTFFKKSLRCQKLEEKLS